MTEDQLPAGRTFFWGVYPDGSEVVTEIDYTDDPEAIEGDQPPPE